MNILVTGATGFIGRHLIPILLARDHSVTIVARNAQRAMAARWFDRVRFEQCDIHVPIGKPCERFGMPDAMIHLAWPGLPNYKSPVHTEQTLPADCRFLESMLEGGLSQLLVAGTCFEYGMQTGCLAETLQARPTNPYGQAKDALRLFLEDLRLRNDFVLQWARLFYIHGEGQNPNSLIAQLDRAIDNGEQVFNMSGGEQLRDYLPVEEVAYRLALLVEQPGCTGVVNVCSGHPISVLDLVRQHVHRRSAEIQLNRGYYPYPDHEPMRFWGDPAKFEKAIREKTNAVRDPRSDIHAEQETND